MTCNVNITAPIGDVETTMSGKVEITVEVASVKKPLSFPAQVKAQISVGETSSNWIELKSVQRGGNSWSGQGDIDPMKLGQQHTCLVKGFVANGQCGSASVNFTPTSTT